MVSRYPVLIAILLSVLVGMAPAQKPDADDARAALREALWPVVRQLGDQDLAVRREAASRLGRLGPAADFAAPELLRAARELAVRPDAVRALSKLGPGAVPALVDALLDPDLWFRMAALEALAGMDDVPVDNRLARVLAGQFLEAAIGELRIAAAAMVRKIAPKLASQPEAVQTLTIAMLASLDKPEKGTQSATASALAAIAARDAKSLSLILAKLDDPSTAGRLAAAEAICGIGPPAAKAVDTLIDWLDSEHWRFRLAAAEALGAMGESARPAIAKLIDLGWVRKLQAVQADEPTPEQAGPVLAQRAAQQALIRLGKLSGDVLPHVIEALKDPRSPRRLTAIETLSAIGPTREHLPLLVAVLGDPQWPAPGQVAAAIAAVGEPAVQTADELLSTPSEAAQLAAVAIIGRLGPAGGKLMPAIVAKVDSPATSSKVRMACVQLLADAGPAAAPAADSLVKLIAAEHARGVKSPDYDTTLMSTAFTALGRMGPAGVQPLIAMLGHKDASIRRQAAMALRLAGKAAEPAIPALVERLGDAEPMMGLTVSMVLGEFGEPAAKLADKALASPDAAVRARAAEVIGRVGPVGAASGGRLFELLADKDPAVRSSAAWALGRLGADVLARPAIRDGLLALLNDEKEPPAVRSAAAASLGEEPNPSADLVRTLGRLLDDPKLRNAAFDALRTIGAKLATRR